MAITVGIPRALTYYKYHPLWTSVLRELGADVVVSRESNKATVNRGVQLGENELCVPVKLALGHAAQLADKCDYLFIPRVVAVEKGSYTCPKFLGLPDMVAAAGIELPPILAPTVNLRESPRKFKKAVLEVGRVLGASDTATWRAFKNGMEALHSYEALLRSGLTPIDIMDGITDAADLPHGDLDGMSIGLVGHPYNLYDRHVSMNLVRQLRKHGVRAVSTEALDPEIIEHEAATLSKELFWTYEREVVGAAFHWARHGGVDGLIYMLSFACGPDSLVQVLIEHEVRRNTELPLMTLVVDEHSAEAGLATRLEAFLDMLRWRRGEAA